MAKMAVANRVDQSRIVNKMLSQSEDDGPARMPEVTEWLGTVEHTIARILGTVRSLEERLSPSVLVCLQPEKESGGEIGAQLVGIASKLRGIEIVAREAENLLESIHSRLEV